MHGHSDTLHCFIRNQLQLSPFYPGTEQAASRTNKEMISIRLFNSSYFTINRHQHM